MRTLCCEFSAASIAFEWQGKNAVKVDPENDHQESVVRKRTCLVSPLIALALSLPGMPARADIGQCGFIKDPDRQAYCRATTGGGAGQCGFIRDPDLQALCRAETGGGKGQCGFIRDRDMQAACRARVAG
ncbi:MAG: hypothetical protein WCG13_15420 [Burkholderiales bacterium]